jgi:hypothetical protein
MKKFIENNFVIIVFVVILLTFFKGCGDSRQISEMKNEIEILKNNTYTKEELSVELQILGLESEKRMIQATDRKLLDIRRQTEIEEEIKKLRNDKK